MKKVSLFFTLLLTVAAVVYEAEDHHVSGGAVKSSSHVHLATDGSRVTFSIKVEEDGDYQLTLGHQNTESSSADVFINGYKQKELSIVPNEKHTTHVTLRTGNNLVAFETSKDNPSIRLDHIIVPRSLFYASRGAGLPYQTYEAEDQQHNGNIIGPDRTPLTLASECSGRRAVQISNGQTISFTLKQQSNGVVVRYSIPDSSNGNGQTASIQLTGDGVSANVTLTSKFSWTYGEYPYSNDPSKKKAHHFFDEVRYLFPSSLSAGSKVKLTSMSGLIITVDLLEFHQVPAPYANSDEVISVTSYGADATGRADSTNAIQTALNSYKGKGKKGIFFPPGRFKTNKLFYLSNVIIGGAGPWYSTVFTDTPGGAGFPAYGPNVRLYDFAISGATTVRIDATDDNAICGEKANGGVAHNIWIEHTKVGCWLNGPTDGYLIENVYIRNTWADGINFRMGVTNSIVSYSSIRNTGDDCIASWSDVKKNNGNIYKYNSVQLPALANTLAIYGGGDHTAYGNELSDIVVSGGCIHVGNRFGAQHLSGNLNFYDNTLVRCGSSNYNRPGHSGAVWVFPEEGPISGGVTISSSDIIDSYSAAVSIFTGTVNNLNFNDLNVQGGLYVLELSGIAGSSNFKNITATGVKVVGTASCVGNKFAVNKSGANKGWDQTSCQNF